MTKKAKKKQLWIRNDIVFDPNLDFPSVFDFEYEEVKNLRSQYRKGKKKKERYYGI
jgi:hypothetical protein